MLSALLALKSAKTREDLAALLRYRRSALTYILYKIPPAARYKTFTLPKKSGGDRCIDAPNPRLKALQGRLAEELGKCLTEIEKAAKHKNRLSHAFRHDASIISNAKAHKSRRYVLNLDLKDFFPSFNFGRVRGFFLANNHFKLAEPVATTIAQIACNDGKLPQGSPCSPVLTELLTHFLDIRLARFARHYKCTYSRYADDLTFSTNQKTFPTALALVDGDTWKLGDELRARIEGSGFVINDAKTRMQCRGSRQSVTGLVVNEKVNVPEGYYKRVRAMTHRFLATGGYQHHGVDKNSLEVLEGMLNHVYHIREREIDLVLLGVSNAEKRAQLQKDRAERKNKYPSAIRTLYHRIVFYKHFIDPPKPLVLCEGPSDPIYLKSAIRKRVAAHPKLGAVKAGKFVFGVQFFKYTKQARDLLQLGGGSPDLKFLLQWWANHISSFVYRPMNHPIIVLIDNDDGAKEIFSLLKGKLFKVNIDRKVDDPFYHLGHNLYLVKTPAMGADGKSCIEDLFEPAVLKTLVDGKVFNPDKEHDVPSEYGKMIFADRVVRQGAAAINFDGFEPLLRRIEAAMDHYGGEKAKRAAPVAAASAAKSAAKKTVRTPKAAKAS